MTDEVSVSMVHREYLVRMLEALACDCDSTDEWENAAPDLRKVAALLRAPTPAERTLLTLVGLTREYLPPDGISKDEFIQRILEALDNDQMAKLIGELEGRK